MKKILYTFMFLFGLTTAAVAQNDQEGGKIREKMVEYIQEKLDLTKVESEKFIPLFINYFKELRQTNQQYKDDRLVLNQKIADLRLRYRDQFKAIIGEKRSNEVFVHEREFIQKAKEERDQRKGNRN